MNIANNYANTSIDTPQVVFTASESTKIDSFTVANNSNANASFQAYIVSEGEAAQFPQIPFEIVVWGENKLGIGIVNQIVPKGGTLQVESSALNSLYFTISGREIEES